MSAFTQSRGRIIQLIFAAVVLVIILQLANLQIFSTKYKLAAENNALYRKIIYPDRGIIFDRNRKPILENIIIYDLVVIPVDSKGTDTAGLCTLLKIDTSEYKKRMRDIINKTGMVRPGIFEPMLSAEMFARLNENLYKFQGFSLTERSVRNYPYHAAGHLLGYIDEVDTSFLRIHKEEGYQMGDYAGRTGLERTYEKILMGKRGVKNYIRDNKSRLQGEYEKGMYDTAAVAGKNVFSSLDVELQKMAEELMTNKVGSVVAIDPATGGILCMVSAPTFDPNYLTGNQRRKHFADLLADPRKPFNNRAIQNNYSPGSTFKTIVGMIGLSEGVIDEQFTVSCGGYFTGCGTGKPKCLDKGTFSFKEAVAHSDNTYFSTVFKRILDQPRYERTDSALNVFNDYAGSFGLGKKLGIDLPSERGGLLPSSAYYQKIYGKRFFPCNIISNAIGQGEVNTTMLQMANVMAIIANKGWFYTPHLIDSIEGGDTDGILSAFKEKRMADNRIPAHVYEAEQNAMQAVMEFGTAAASAVPGIVVCGKTGTVENYAKVNGRVEKQQDHSFFGAFAPKDKPRIAIAVICENAGQGAWAAAPIASLLIEKYLKDSISGSERKEKFATMVNKNLIPKLMRIEMAKNDSLKQIKESKLEQQRLLRESIEKAAEDASGFDQPLIPAIPETSKKPGLKEAIIPKQGEKKKKYSIS
ncbi:MAG: penicillin-binding protein 2 [Chitinophagia bacterium]|nr:penicillin-binding protein 2 [Chitinophagia bacterium]